MYPFEMHRPSSSMFFLYRIIACCGFIFSLHMIFLFSGINPLFAQEKTGDNTSPARQDIRVSAPSSGDSVKTDKQTVPHVYRINYWVSGSFAILATAGDAYAIPHILHNKPRLTDAEINALNPNVFNVIDRWALRQDPTKRDAYYRVSDIMLPSIMLSAVSLGFDSRIRKEWERVLMMYYEMHAGVFTTYNFSFFGPAFQNKIRPLAYYPEMPLEQREGGNQRNSMFSGHMANATASTFFMAKVYSDFHPEIGRKKYLLYALATIPPMVEGYLRIKALAHFPSDVLVGYAIGAVAGISVPALHRNPNRKVEVGLASLPSGAGLRIAWKLGQKKFNPKENYFVAAASQKATVITAD
jgi:hypothetical protein